ncbi:hypothetical protein BKA62DRAFT_715197 [Auriculariales sp. MPI-PUGE-AT-0066]|nr:hypothetical protein BKA62DRAFT_715197 [Auriculariales sp. MPI-PUGE-AT-0066]
MSNVATQTRVTASIEQLIAVVQSIVAEAARNVNTLKDALSILRTTFFYESLEHLLDVLRARRLAVRFLSRDQQNEALTVMHRIQFEARHALVDAQCLSDEVRTELAVRLDTALSKIVIMRQTAQRDIDAFERRLCDLVTLAPVPQLQLPPRIEFSSDEEPHPSPQPSPHPSPLHSHYKSEPGPSPRSKMYGSECERSYVTTPGLRIKHLTGAAWSELHSPDQLLADDMDCEEEENEFEVTFTGVRSKAGNEWTPPTRSPEQVIGPVVWASPPRHGVSGSPGSFIPPGLVSRSAGQHVLTTAEAYPFHGRRLVLPSPPTATGGSFSVSPSVVRGSTEENGTFQVQGSLTVRRRTRIRGKRGRGAKSNQLAASLAVPLLIQAQQQTSSPVPQGLGLGLSPRLIQNKSTVTY